MTDRPAPVRVAVSNDYDLVLRGVEGILAPHRDRIELVATTVGTDVPDGVDLVLFDTFGRLPLDDEKLRAVVTRNPQARVVVYSWDSYPAYAARAHGAVGWIDKAVPEDQLVAALLAVHRDGKIEVHPDLSASDPEPNARWPGQEHGLSARESEILAHVCRGLSNAEIARQSYLSINTVKTYIRGAYRKIGVSRRAQAVLWGLAHGFGADAAEDGST